MFENLDNSKGRESSEKITYESVDGLYENGVSGISYGLIVIILAPPN